MTNTVNSELQFLHFDVNKIQFISNPDYEAPEVEVDLEFDSAIERSNEYIAQKVSVEVFPNGLKNGMPFQLQIDLTGHFLLVDGAEQLETGQLEVNTLSILFPYLRSLVTTITANANVPALVLPPLNIVKTLERKNKLGT